MCLVRVQAHTDVYDDGTSYIIKHSNPISSPASNPGPAFNHIPCPASNSIPDSATKPTPGPVPISTFKYDRIVRSSPIHPQPQTGLARPQPQPASPYTQPLNKVRTYVHICLPKVTVIFHIILGTHATCFVFLCMHTHTFFVCRNLQQCPLSPLQCRNQS